MTTTIHSPAIFSRMTRLAASAATALVLSACASIPGANVAPGTPITAEEARVGQEAHPQFIQQFGGRETGPAAAYVEAIGKDVAVRSGLAGARDSFTVTTLDSSVNNAFAIPGGYVYITRQLVGLMNNEAELAGVLGHEVGHVAARHSSRRQANAQRNQLLGVLGQVASAVLLGDSGLGRLGQQIAGQAPQLATLSYSRNQELEADQLGVQYLSESGYDPRAMATVLASLAAQNSLDSQLQGRGNATLPEWASTHPDPASRVNDALSFAAGKPGNVTNRDRFLTRIDGLVYGDKPSQGVIEGDAFIHPELRLSFRAPNGFYMVNSTRAVSVNGDRGQAQFTLGEYNGNLDTYVRSQFQALGSQQQQVAPQTLERTTVNGIPAVYGVARVNSGQQQVDVTVFAYEFANDRAYHFLTITQAGQSGVFGEMYQSMRRISASEAARIVPRVIDVIVAGSNDTVASMSRRMAFDSGQEARFRVLNGLNSSDRVQAGQSYKVVVRGR